MPKRNLLLLTLIGVVSLVACFAREHGRRGRSVGEVLAAIERSYLDPVAPDELETAALEAVVGQLDDYSAIVAGPARRELEAALDQQFGGVGLELMAADGSIVVHAPIVGGPAWRAGIRAGDRIVAIDGDPTAGLSVRDAVASLRGDAGSVVAVEVRSPEGSDATGPAAESRRVELTREVVRTESVLGDRRRSDGSWDWLLEGEPGIGFVRITTFGERTATELDAALAVIAAGDPRGLVIDLRGNPGGLLASAVEVCDRFLDDGLIVATRRRGAGSGETFDARRATAGRVLADVPIVVLIDGLTASAAEIVAACLQDHGRATVVGCRSFGKGTVQSIIPLADGKRLLKLTTAEYRRPRDEGRAGWCVVPDPGGEIDVPAQRREATIAWRRQRDLPSGGAEAAAMSAGDLPRHRDAVIAKAVAAIEEARQGPPGD